MLNECEMARVLEFHEQSNNAKVKQKKMEKKNIRTDNVYLHCTCSKMNKRINGLLSYYSFTHIESNTRNEKKKPAWSRHTTQVFVRQVTNTFTVVNG